MSTLAKLGRTLARLLLTLFVVGQFVYLLTSNFLGVEEPLRTAVKDYVWGDPPRGAQTAWTRLHNGVQAVAKDTQPDDFFEGKGPIHEDYYNPVRTFTKHWGQLTGQPESWGLFAPDVGKLVPFPAVELRWDDEDWPEWAEKPPPLSNQPPPVVVLSDNEPLPPADEPDRRDRYHFIRFGEYRIRKYESQTFLCSYQAAPDGVFLPHTNDWRESIRKVVREDSECTRRYLRWRMDVYLRAYPNLPPPTQVILLWRAYQIPAPPGKPPPAGPDPWDWYDLGEHRVARWLPSAPLATDKYKAVERYDPIANGFTREEK